MTTIQGTRATLEIKVTLDYREPNKFDLCAVGKDVAAFLRAAKRRHQRVQQVRLTAEALYVTVEVALDDALSGEQIDRWRHELWRAWKDGLADVDVDVRFDERTVDGDKIVAVVKDIVRRDQHGYGCAWDSDVTKCDCPLGRLRVALGLPLVAPPE